MKEIENRRIFPSPKLTPEREKEIKELMHDALEAYVKGWTEDPPYLAEAMVELFDEMDRRLRVNEEDLKTDTI